MKITRIQNYFYNNQQVEIKCCGCMCIKRDADMRFSFENI